MRGDHWPTGDLVDVRARGHGIPGAIAKVRCPWCHKTHRIEASEPPAVGDTRWCNSTELAFRVADPDGRLEQEVRR